MVESKARGPGASRMAAFAVLCVAGVLFVVPPPEGMTVAMVRTGALTVFAIGFWATAVIPIGLTATAFFLFAALFAVQPLEIIFSGFASAAIWLVFGGIVIGVAVGHTGLGDRWARSLIGRFGGSYATILFGIACVGIALGFVMPSSMGRVLLLTPIVSSLADRLGYAPGSRGRTGMIMTTALITFTSAGAILPSLVPGMMLAGLAHGLYDLEINYGAYLTLHFPVIGIVKGAVIVAVATAMYAEDPVRDPDAGARPPVTREEIFLSAILGVSLLLWVTDWLHGISPAWVALGAAVVIFLFGNRLVPDRAFNEKLDYASVFYVAAVLGLSKMLLVSGLANQVGQWMISVVPFVPGADGANYAALTLISTFLGLVVTNPGVPAVLSPLAQDAAAATGLPVLTVLMTQVFGFTNVVLPYQASPVVVAMTVAGVRLRDGAKFTLAVTAVSLLALAPLNYFWWRLIGMFPGSG